MWLIIIIVFVAVLYLVIRNTSLNNQPSETQAVQQVVWQNPSGAKEHLAMFSVLGEAISSFDSVAFVVSYDWGPNKDDVVTMSFYGINNTSVYKDTDVGKYISSLSGDEWSARCVFSFDAGQGGAPYYFRTNDAVLGFVQKFAPHAELDTQLSDADVTSIRFVKHDLAYTHLPENLSATTLRAIHS